MRKSAIAISIVGLALTAWVATDKIEAVEPDPVLIIEEIEPIDQSAQAQAWLSSHGVNVPDEIIAECEGAGAFYDICPELLEAIAWKESRFTPTAQNGSFVGLMQMHKGIHKDRIERFGIDAYDPHASIWAAASLLHDIGEEYTVEGESPEASVLLAAYHGEDNVYSYSTYTKKILEVSEALERAHGK